VYWGGVVDYTGNVESSKKAVESNKKGGYRGGSWGVAGVLPGC
jgi:hypothetical protein